jgi:hypothetical protein
MKTKAPPSDGRFAYEGLDRVIHERARLSVLTSLVTNPKGLAFGDLKQLCALTDGNLSRHLRVLEKGPPQPSTDDLPNHGFGPCALYRVSIHARASGSGCGKSYRRRARDRTSPRPSAVAGLNFFCHITLQRKVNLICVRDYM